MITPALITTSGSSFISAGRGREEGDGKRAQRSLLPPTQAKINNPAMDLFMAGLESLAQPKETPFSGVKNTIKINRAV